MAFVRESLETAKENSAVDREKTQAAKEAAQKVVAATAGSAEPPHKKHRSATGLGVFLFSFFVFQLTFLR